MQAPVLVQDGEIINQDPDEVYEPEGHLCMAAKNGSGSASGTASASTTTSTSARRSAQLQRGEAPRMFQPRPGHQRTSAAMMREPLKVIAKAKFENASEGVLLYKSRRFPGVYFGGFAQFGSRPVKKFHLSMF